MKKHNTFNFGLMIVVTLLLISCKERVNMEEELQSMFNADKKFAELSRQKGAAEAFYEFADDDAIMLSKNSDPVIGRLKIKEAMEGMENYLLAWAPENGLVSQSADLGYTWGRFELSFDDAEGVEQIRTGKYVSIWKKQADGKWKWVVDIGNTDDPK